MPYQNPGARSSTELKALLDGLAEVTRPPSVQLPREARIGGLLGEMARLLEV